MSGRLTRSAYVTLVDEDLAWLKKQPNSLENGHIEVVLLYSIDSIYPITKAEEHHWLKSIVPRMMERCCYCLTTRTISAGAMWEYFDPYHGSSGFNAPSCASPKDPDKARNDS